MTIRAFYKAETYVQRMYEKVDRHAQTWWHLWLFNQWFGFRMDSMGAVFSMTTAALIVSIPGMRASLAGFALSFALQYTFLLSSSLCQYALVELDMNATERVMSQLHGQRRESSKLCSYGAPDEAPTISKLPTVNP